MSRIAVSVRRGGRGLQVPLDERFGRAEAFLVVERETGEALETIDNASAQASRGAGTAAANALKSAGIGAVISGRFGPNALNALRGLGIEAWIAPPNISARDALRMLEEGVLEPTRPPSDR